MSAGEGRRRAELLIAVRTLVERERRSLIRASALLACVRIALLHDYGINVVDLVEVANDLVGNAIRAFDAEGLAQAANAHIADDDE
jgi:hypothetical protein